MKRFLEHLNQSDVSASTRLGYTYDITSFINWYQCSNGAPAELALITPADLVEYKNYLRRTERLEPSTINRRLSALRAMFRWALRSQLIPLDPSDQLKLLPIQRKPPKWLDRQGQFKLVRELQREIQLAERRGPTAVARKVRNQSLIMLLLHTGLRASELCDLELASATIGERSGYLDIDGKGDKRRRVPLNATARNYLQLWLAIRPELKPLNGALFISNHRGRITRQQINQIVSMYGRRAGITCTPHTLRHTFAHNLILGGVSIDQVADLLGHAKIETTRIYIRPGAAELAASVESLCEQ